MGPNAFSPAIPGLSPQMVWDAVSFWRDLPPSTLSLAHAVDLSRFCVFEANSGELLFRPYFLGISRPLLRCAIRSFFSSA
jgi:hypothetical protein